MSCSLRALNWLKKYNQIYKEFVTIDESNLAWMDGAEEAELLSSDVVTPEKKRTFTLHSMTLDKQRLNAFLPWAVKMNWMNLKPVIFTWRMLHH